MTRNSPNPGLYDANDDYSSCGVGFLTRKDGKQTHKLLEFGHQALCAIPHRGGMSAEGVGDGAGISVDLSVKFFSDLSKTKLVYGKFGVGNFFLPNDNHQHQNAITIVEKTLEKFDLKILLKRAVPVDDSKISARAKTLQLPIKQWVFKSKVNVTDDEFEFKIHKALLYIESTAYTNSLLDGFYPLSLSSRLQNLKGRLNSWELIPYFADLQNKNHCINTLYFHTRFSTNTDPHPTMAQPFRLMAHNGELNTDKKNRLSESATALARNKSIVRPKGQSDSCRLDQTLNSRVFEEGLDLVTAVVSMMPPAWENDKNMNPKIKAMLEYFSLFEEKNDGPAALIFGDGKVVGARLDRLGLRPLRTVETDEYLAVMSEAGQINFDSELIISRGRVEAGGMIYYDHTEKKTYRTQEALFKLASKDDYELLLKKLCLKIAELPEPILKAGVKALPYNGKLDLFSRYVAYAHNQESFKFLMDPMLHFGTEKVSAMGYGNAINALSDAEGGMARYFSQRFAQVTNPPLDSIREADGMTLRVALGEKPYLGRSRSQQIIISSPILNMTDFLKIKEQAFTPCKTFEILFRPSTDGSKSSEHELIKALNSVSEKVAKFAREKGGIAILSDRNISKDLAAIPLILAISGINQKLIEEGLRLKVSLILESGQIASSHHIACSLGFGASAVYPLAVTLRAEELFGLDKVENTFESFKKAAEKALMKTMGKVGLCTAESYIGGEFFEPNFLDTNDEILSKYLPNMKTPVGGVKFSTISQSVCDWHKFAQSVTEASQIPILGLFKERSEGAGHSFGTAAVRGFVDLTEERINFVGKSEENLLEGETDPFRLMTLSQMNDAFGFDERNFENTSFDKISKEMVNNFKITAGYREFSKSIAKERLKSPAALRDVLSLPADISEATSSSEFETELMKFSIAGNNSLVVNGIECRKTGKDSFLLNFSTVKPDNEERVKLLDEILTKKFDKEIIGKKLSGEGIKITASGLAADYLSKLQSGPEAISLSQVQPAYEITSRFASGAMSHGALVASAHEAVAHGTNMVGGLSNSGEGGEHISRYGTLRASRIKQFASGRFGVWAGYLADPKLEEIEIKIGQGAKPGEGGQLPAQKVTVEIAAARGGTPGVELISPPPHHDTYSIEDLGQLIHDAKAARVRVIVKLVSSEGIGTIAVGVAKAGADIINIAGNTGGTGAASVTSLKYTGRAAEIGIAEVHQALCANKIRQKVLLRCSGAMQTGLDVIKASLLGADSFEFGTTALMMLKCVMAKNCNVKCPAGLTTNAETFDGDPRALAQYLLNVAHEVREILSSIGLHSLDESCGRSDLLHLLEHPASVGQLNLRDMLVKMEVVKVSNPIYVEKDYSFDDELLGEVKTFVKKSKETHLVLHSKKQLNNRNKSVGGQLSIDIERFLNYEIEGNIQKVLEDNRGRKYLGPKSIKILTSGSAGQSFGAFCNDGMVFEHTGTCNDGVGKACCGGEIVIKSPFGGGDKYGDNVLVGNFSLFGATGGRIFIQGEAGDRFGVRNSGATAVVEGVGEFCAEYMTNGTILNIGGFSKGLGNGMSGGFIYQYDPEDNLENLVSHDSVITGRLGSNTFQDNIHIHSVRQLLEWHLDATGSIIAKELLEDWDNKLSKIVWVMPRALLQYQDSDAILAYKSRKELVDELSDALASYQVNELKIAWKRNSFILNGATPNSGINNESKMFRLLNSYTVLEMAQLLVRKKLGKDISKEYFDKSVRNLILTEDFALMTALSKHARTALSGYNDKEIATLVANKRLTDFKQTLSMRNVLSMDSPSTYSWILHQGRKNLSALGEIPSFDELFAMTSVKDIMTRLPTEMKSENAFNS